MLRWKVKRKYCNIINEVTSHLAPTKLLSRGHHRWQRKDYFFEAVKFNTMISPRKTRMIANETLSDLFALKDTLLPKRSLKIVSYYKHRLSSGYFWRKLCYEIVCMSHLMPISKSVCNC